MLANVSVISLLAALGACARLPPSDALQLPSHSPNLSHAVQRRSESSEVFDIAFQAQDESIFSGSWTVEPPVAIPVAPSVDVKPEDTVSVSLNCNDCRTYGNISADINSDDGLGVMLTFDGVGAYMDFGVSASNTLTVAFRLGKFLDPELNLISGGFEANIGLGLSIVLSLTTAVDFTGGFQLCIPDGAQLAFEIDIDVDPTTGLLVASADIKTLPDITFSALPVAISSTAANVTAALVLRTEASISADVGLVKGNVGAGASLTLVEVNFGEVRNTAPGTCRRALFIDVESNAGAFAQASLTLLDDELLDVGPSVSTVFATAGTTTCLGTNIPTPKPAPTTTAAATGCLTTVTRTDTLTSCRVPAINCPPSLTQLIVVTGIETVAATNCPATATIKARQPSTTACPSSSSSSATPSPTSHAPATCLAGGTPLTPLAAPIVASLPPEYSTVSGAANATITGIVERVPAASGTVGLTGTGTGTPGAAATYTYVTAGAAEGRRGVGMGLAGVVLAVFLVGGL
ncbi:hypothetical protein B0T25DRAFT_576752 [Lasiosphaeria hispida]|uniref:GPI anchored protein n=1 Tax=Lasiosphaeria hispida TaxID=260671 RepID=A0AAJ0HX43_9PEZI|nr:hypothetical protein B0T25DRAFT_576752 [Lasiosphaeria hispida]